MKKITGKLLALLLCAAMLCVPATATENDAPQRDSLAPVRTWGTITRQQDGRFLLENTAKNEVVLLGTTKETLCLDAVTGLPLALTALKDGEMVYAYINPTMLLSEPPQTDAVLFLANIPADFAAPLFYTITDVKTTAEGVTLSTDRGESVTVAKTASVFPYLTKNIVTIDSLQVGTRILVWTGTDKTVTKVMVFAEKASQTFQDVAEGDWCYDAVRYVVQAGLMSGSKESFNPNSPLTRAQTAAIFYRLAGEPALEYPEGKLYSDVKADAYYNTAVYWARQNSIMQGFSDEVFAPNKPITREQMAAVIYRYVKLQGGGFVANWMFLLDFTDRADIAASAYEGVAWCVKDGILTGSDGKLNPKSPLTRAQAATMLMRYLEK